jgi:hypothetical protein
MAAAAQAHGVTIRYGTSVASIEHTARRATAVITDSGERIAADVVIVNADLPVAHRDLLGRDPWSIKRLTYSPSAFVMLIGSDRAYPATAHHNIHFGRAWRRTFDELIDSKRLMSDPSLMVTHLNRDDPALAPAGKHAYYVLFPTPNATADIDWTTEAKRYRDDAIAVMEQRGYQGFGDSIEVEHLTTPQDWLDRGMAAGAPFTSTHVLPDRSLPTRQPMGRERRVHRVGDPPRRRRAHGAGLRTPRSRTSDGTDARGSSIVGWPTEPSKLRLTRGRSSRPLRTARCAGHHPDRVGRSGSAGSARDGRARLAVGRGPAGHLARPGAVRLMIFAGVATCCRPGWSWA